MPEEFRIKIDARMLELLSKDLYTNVYFSLAELIANGYDADAKNVYVIIGKDYISVEDDGHGMTPQDVREKYLEIGKESRANKDQEKSASGRRLKMGRKGVGKLAALSVSDSYKLFTKTASTICGIIVPKKIDTEGGLLKEIPTDQISFYKSENETGTAVIMENVKLKISDDVGTIKNNLSKIFPFEIEDFKIHIVKGRKKITLSKPEETIINRLVTLITLGDGYSYIKDYFKPDTHTVLEERTEAITKKIKMTNRDNEEKEYTLEIKGWLGTYKSTRGVKKEIQEFSDNYIAVFANNKMGARNILNIVGKNRIYDSYIAGNLYIDLFEESSLPDMASTNRQGYSESDLRWKEAVELIRNLSDEVVANHLKYTKSFNKAKHKEMAKAKQAEEEKLKSKVAEFASKTSKQITDKFDLPQGIDSTSFESIVNDSINKNLNFLGLKAKLDTNKRKVLISHTFEDRDIANIIYAMLKFNGLEPKFVIHTNSEDDDANLPEGHVYDHLQKFFVDSASDRKIHVLFVTSTKIFNSGGMKWGVMMEIGAAWITKKDHAIFNVLGFNPEAPLDILDKKVTLTRPDESTICLSPADVNTFCNKVMLCCTNIEITPKTLEENKAYLSTLITISE